MKHVEECLKNVLQFVNILLLPFLTINNNVLFDISNLNFIKSGRVVEQAAHISRDSVKYNEMNSFEQQQGIPQKELKETSLASDDFIVS